MPDSHQGFMFGQNEPPQQSKRPNPLLTGTKRNPPVPPEPQSVDKAVMEKLVEKTWEMIKASHEGLTTGQSNLDELVKQSHDDLAARLISMEERFASFEKWGENIVSLISQISGGSSSAPAPKRGKRNSQDLLHEVTTALLNVWQNPQAQRIGISMKKDSITNELERACGRSDLASAIAKANTSSPLWRGFKSWFVDQVGSIQWRGIEFVIQDRVMTATPSAANAPLSFLDDKFQNLEHHGSVDNIDIEEIVKQTRVVLGQVPQGKKFKLLELIPSLDLDEQTKAVLADPSSGARGLWKKELREQELICIADKKDFRKGEYVKGPILL